MQQDSGSAIRSATRFTQRLGWFGVVIGICLAIIGLVILLQPGASLVLLSILVGIELLVVGVLRVVSGVSSRELGGRWRLIVIAAGVLTLGLGIACLFRPSDSLTVLAVLMAIGWIVDGVATLAAAFLAPDRRSRVRQILFGLGAVVAGVLVIVWPDKSLVLITQLVAVILLVLGVLAIVVAVPQVRAGSATPADSDPDA